MIVVDHVQCRGAVSKLERRSQCAGRACVVADRPQPQSAGIYFAVLCFTYAVVNLAQSVRHAPMEQRFAVTIGGGNLRDLCHHAR